MNNWIILALLAPALYSLVVFVDKYLVSNQVKDYRSLPIFAGIMGTICGSIIWFFTGRPLLNLFDAIIALVTGFLTIISFIPYYKSVTLEEPSKINIYFQLAPLLILLLSWLILGDKITVNHLVGFIFIILSVIIISLKKNKTFKKFTFSKALYFVLIYNLLVAISAILVKFTLNFNNLSSILSYPSWGAGVGALVLYLFSRDIRIAFHQNITTLKIKTITVMLLNEGLFILARTITYAAYSIGSVSLISALEGTQVFYGIFFGWFFTRLFPSLVKENISRKNIALKIFASIILIIGIYFITIV